jgi:hypothetical protein
LGSLTGKLYKNYLHHIEKRTNADNVVIVNIRSETNVKLAVNLIEGLY